MDTRMKPTFLKKTPLFKDLSTSELEAIGQDLKCQLLNAGEIVFTKDEAGSLLYLLESGQVRAFVSSDNGVETSVILCGTAGDFFGELAAFDEQPRSATAVALTNTIVWKLSCDDLFKHVYACPQLAINIIIELSQRVRYNTKRIHMFSSKNIKQRIAETIVDLAGTFGINESNKNSLELKLTQEELANLVGATRESTNRHLSNFQKKKWLQKSRRGHIMLQNIEALQSYANA